MEKHPRFEMWLKVRAPAWPPQRTVSAVRFEVKGVQQVFTWMGAFGAPHKKPTRLYGTVPYMDNLHQPLQARALMACDHSASRAVGHVSHPRPMSTLPQRRRATSMATATQR